MIIRKAGNSYRSIGGRSNASGVERVNRDGKMEVLKPEDTEVTPKERMIWNSKAKLDPRGRIPEEIYDVEKDESGNKMALEKDERTRLPRKHQYSTESRLLESRDEKPIFNTSSASKEQAYGIVDGSVQNNDFVDPAKNEKTKMASAFCKISKELMKTSSLSNKFIVKVSDSFQIPIEDVLLLEKVALSNKKLSFKYSAEDIKQDCNCNDKNCKICQEKNIPGLKDSDDNKLEKESDEEIAKSADEVGLLE